MSRFIVLYKYNNYYNRIVKTQDTFQAYLSLITPGQNSPASYNGFLRESKNFNYADGVYTKHVVNISKNEPLFAKSESPDYFVLEETFKEGETSVTKLSRWFILEADRIRGDQYELSLRRDLLADYYSQVVNRATVFIQRGTPTLNDPLIFNKEGFTFNQIKKHEILLNNNKLSGNKGGWVVGYLARGTPAYGLNNCPCALVNPAESIPQYSSLPQRVRELLEYGAGLAYDMRPSNSRYYIEFPIKAFAQSKNDIVWRKVGFIVNYNNRPGVINLTPISSSSSDRFSAAVYFYKTSLMQGNPEDYPSGMIIWNDERLRNYIDGDIGNFAYLTEAFDTYYHNLTRPYDFDATLIDQWDGKFFIKDGRIFKIKFSRDISYNDQIVDIGLRGVDIKTTSPTDLAFAAQQLLLNLINPITDNSIQWNPDLNLNNICFRIQKTIYSYLVEAELADAVDFTVDIPATRNNLLDSPYDMFCMPLGNVTVKRTGHDDFITALNVAMAAARGIAAVGTAEKVLDIQILPYCPYPEILNSNGEIDLRSAGFVEGNDYTIISNTVVGVTTELGVIIYPKYSKGSFDYDLSSDINNLGETEEKTYLQSILNPNNDIYEKKIISETSFIRFVSPNFASMYDMIPQKNNGVDIINIDYYYKPYTPYIHVMPVLHDGGLYGKDYNDPKGLICSGDFSIATASSKWEEYQVQNKNFKEQFDRQIQNLDVNNSINLEKAQITGGINIGTSILGGAAAGAVAGSAGGPVGAIIGGAVGAIGGGVASLIGYTKDIEYLKKQQSEARGYSVDMYTYQLGNIQALPNTLNRVSAFTPNNKIFPFIEFYDCTDEEKEALRSKIEYNAMTIMKIGHIWDYIQFSGDYVQGQLIRLEGIDEDSHVVAEIANEIKEGAYFYG